MFQKLGNQPKGELKMSEKKFDVAVIGNVGIDTNIYPELDEINFNVEANFTANVDYIGQAGGYGARGFAQLDYRSAFIGCVGEDYHGEFIKKTFRADGINIDGIFIDPAGTSRSVNFMFPDGRRKNFYDGKSHMNIGPDLEVCKQIMANTKVLHFNIPNWARTLLPIAKELGIVVSTDLQDIVHLEDSYREDFIKYSDVIFFSSVNFENPGIVMESINKKHPNKIIISGMGKKGCAIFINNDVRYFDSIEFGDPVIDTNGAGDGLAVGFLSQYFLEGRSIEQSIMSAQIVARYTCSKKASTKNLITQKILNDVLNKIPF